MSKITNDGLTLSDTGCFTAVPTWQQWASFRVKGLTLHSWTRHAGVQSERNGDDNNTVSSSYDNRTVSRVADRAVRHVITIRYDRRV